MERLQARVPDARFVKAFSCVGNALMVKPSLPGGPPTMFICGNDDAAKAAVTALLTQFGWDTEDLGTAKAARVDRAARAAVVHPRLPREPLDARVAVAARLVAGDQGVMRSRVRRRVRRSLPAWIDPWAGPNSSRPPSKR